MYGMYVVGGRACCVRHMREEEMDYVRKKGQIVFISKNGIVSFVGM